MGANLIALCKRVSSNPFGIDMSPVLLEGNVLGGRLGCSLVNDV